MEKRRLLLGLVAIGILAISVLVPVISSRQGPPTNFVQEKKFELSKGYFYRTEITRLPATFEVSTNKSRIGISVEPFLLEFGVMPKNITSKKIVDLKNSRESPVKVKLKSYGNISPFLQFRNDFTLDSNQNKSVRIKASGNKLGKYKGEVQVIIKIPKNRWAKWLLPLV